MKFVRHTVAAGERIDIISKRYYGRVDNIEPVLKFNPQLKFTLILSDYVGETIIIPVDDNSRNYDVVKPGIKGVL